jgi:hypothetical protein
MRRAFTRNLSDLQLIAIDKIAAMRVRVGYLLWWSIVAGFDPAGQCHVFPLDRTSFSNQPWNINVG